MTDPIIPDQHKELATRIERALSQIRPYLQADQGDITLKEITDDLIVKVELHGSCVGCSLIDMTMKGGVESVIKNVAPEVKSIEAINL
ncbi:MAG TPA: NifU family protein [Methylococcaceae bacterium]|nr:NifU family protein [Methylococcaceae bacterium]